MNDSRSARIAVFLPKIGIIGFPYLRPLSGGEEFYDFFGRPGARVRAAAGGRMPAADDRSWNGIYRRSGPAASPRGREIDFQLFTSGHPPGALMRAAAAARQSLRPAERPCAWRSSRRCSKCKITYTCCNAKRRPPRAPLLSCLHPAVFVRPAPWSSCRSGEAPAAGTKTFAGCCARIPLRPLARSRPANPAFVVLAGSAQKAGRSKPGLMWPRSTRSIAPGRNQKKKAVSRFGICLPL